MTDSRITRHAIEVIQATTEVPDARVTRSGLEVIHQTVEVPDTRVTRMGLEVIHSYSDLVPVGTIRALLNISFQMGVPYVWTPTPAVPLSIVSGGLLHSTDVLEFDPVFSNTYIPTYSKYEHPGYVTGGYYYEQTDFVGSQKLIPSAVINDFNIDWILRIDADTGIYHSAQATEFIIRLYDSSNNVQFFMELYHAGNYDNWIRYGVSSGTTTATFVLEALQNRGLLTFTSTSASWAPDTDIPANRLGAAAFTQTGLDLSDITRVEITDLTLIKYGESQTLSINLVGGTLGAPYVPSAGEYQFYRILVTETQAESTNVAIAEMEFRTSIGGANITLTGADASGDIGGSYVASMAIDDNANTMWNSAYTAGVSWWSVSVGQPKVIAEYTMMCRHDNTAWLGDTPIRWTVQGSNDNTTWTNLKDETTGTWSTLSEVRTFTI